MQSSISNITETSKIAITNRCIISVTQNSAQNKSFFKKNIFNRKVFKKTLDAEIWNWSCIHVEMQESVFFICCGVDVDYVVACAGIDLFEIKHQRIKEPISCYQGQVQYKIPQPAFTYSKWAMETLEECHIVLVFRVNKKKL